MATEKIAITVDAALLADVERLRQRTGESRSAVFNRAVRELLEARERERAVERYVQAYRDQPETTEEVSAAEHIALESLRSAPGWNAK